jgi:ribonucleoside-diphosphate reductase beta chain
LWWTSFEQIHSKSYQWILQNVFPNPSVTFDTITLDPNIVDRAKAIIKFYDDFISYSNDVRSMGFGDHTLTSVSPSGEAVTRQVSLNLRELKRRLYLALMSVYVLESIRFYVSFACSFAFGQRGIMVGNANIIKLIARDEAQHVGLVVNILKNLVKHEGDYAQIAVEVHDEVMNMFDEAVAQEREWIKYLFKDGSLIGLNETLLNQYLEHIANKRLKTAGFKPRYDGQQNPFGWLSSWLSTEDYQVAPQEQEITDYLIGAINADVDDSNLIDF